MGRENPEPTRGQETSVVLVFMAILAILVAAFGVVPRLLFGPPSPASTPTRVLAPTASLEATATETATPSPTVRLTLTRTRSVEAQYHLVERGETLDSIARQYGVDPDLIAAANGLTDPSHIQVGQVLYIPSAISPPTETPFETSTPTPTAETAVTATVTPIPNQTDVVIPTPGRLQLTYSTRMVVEQTAIVALEVNPMSSRVVVYPPGQAPPAQPIIIERLQHEITETVNSDIELYPVMSAKLEAGNFSLTGDDGARRPTRPNRSSIWIWHITALKAGPQRITVKVFREYGPEENIDPELVWSATRTIQVDRQALPTRIGDSLTEDPVGVFGAVIAAVTAALAWLTRRSTSQLQDTLSQLQPRLDQLAQVVRGMQSQPYVGNTQTKKLHRASCAAVPRIAEGNKAYFSSRDAALAAGYQPCDNCDP